MNTKQTLLSLLLPLLPLLAAADAVEIGGIYYNLIPKGKVAEVTMGSCKAGDTDGDGTVDAADQAKLIELLQKR